jgi:hypothetical protein
MAYITLKTREAAEFGGKLVMYLGSLACILQWLDIKPEDFRMTPAPHSIAWLVLGLSLFAIGIGSSGYSLYRNVAADPCRGLFTPLQIKMLRLRQGLIDLLASEPNPEQGAGFVTAHNRRDERLASKYEVGLKQSATALFHQLRIMGLAGDRMKYLAEESRTAPLFEELIETLWALVPKVKEGK